MKRVIKGIFLGVMLLIAVCLYGCGALKFSKTAAPNKPTLPVLNNKRFALVLGGGGAKGMAHIGVLEEFEKAGLKPDLIVGCSAGAIVGALYAAHPDITSLKTLVLAGKQADVITLTMAAWPYSLYDDNHLANYLRKHIKQHNFADLKVPLIVTATNLEFGNLTAFGQGDIIAPIMASAAVPGAFAPVQIEGQYYVDCGVADPIPVRLARRLGYETIVAVNIAEKLPPTPPNHALGVMKRSSEIAYVAQCAYAMEDADIKIDFDFNGIGMFSDQYNEYLYEQGRAAGRKAVPKILERLHQGANGANMS